MPIEHAGTIIGDGHYLACGVRLSLDVAKIEAERRGAHYGRHKWRCSLYSDFHGHSERTMPGNEKDISRIYSRLKAFCINSDMDKGTGRTSQLTFLWRGRQPGYC